MLGDRGELAAHGVGAVSEVDIQATVRLARSIRRSRSASADERRLAGGLIVQGRILDELIEGLRKVDCPRHDKRIADLESALRSMLTIYEHSLEGRDHDCFDHGVVIAVRKILDGKGSP